MTIAADYLETVLRELQRLKGLADRALERVGEEAFFREPGFEENSLAMLVKHMAGNMRSRWTDFLTSDGEKRDRERDTEFVIGEADTRASLMARWETEWQTLFDAIEPLTVAELSATVEIRGEPHTVVAAVQRQLTHYAYHVGQIVQLARHLADDWESLSIPRGASAAFNARPDYLKP